MATGKREIYARMATQLLTHERCTIAEVACPGAMGLYLFLVMQARHEKTHGETLEALAMASWGAPMSYRRRQATALIVAGLVERQGDRLVVVRYLDHNDGPEEIEANKEAVRKRVEASRNRQHVTRYTPVTDTLGNAHVPSSGSSSISDLKIRSPEPDPARATPPANDNGPPAWWATACETVGASVAPVDEPNARWLEYAAARERKGWATNQRDAVGWLSQVVRRERRDAKVAPMRGPGGGPRGDRQGLGGWTPPASTGTGDPFGGDS